MRLTDGGKAPGRVEKQPGVPDAQAAARAKTSSLRAWGALDLGKGKHLAGATARLWEAHRLGGESFLGLTDHARETWRWLSGRHPDLSFNFWQARNTPRQP
jgi:hypothetical protein